MLSPLSPYRQKNDTFLFLQLPLHLTGPSLSLFDFLGFPDMSLSQAPLFSQITFPAFALPVSLNFSLTNA